MEEQSNWPAVLSLNELFHYAIITLFLSTFWMIIVSINVSRAFMFILIVPIIFELVGYILAGAVNDKSQFAKLFLIVAQFFTLIAGIMTIWISNIYYEMKMA